MLLMSIFNLGMCNIVLGERELEDLPLLPACKFRELALSDIIDKILARLPAYFAAHLNVQFNDISPADQSV
jgi:hypothetical protein